jgi:hypothetical protein
LPVWPDGRTLLGQCNSPLADEMNRKFSAAHARSTLEPMNSSGRRPRYGE